MGGNAPRGSSCDAMVVVYERTVLGDRGYIWWGAVRLKLEAFGEANQRLTLP